jgi:hypothetical protein
MSLPAIETTCTLTQRVLLPAVFVEKCAVLDATRVVGLSCLFSRPSQIRSALYAML